MSRIHGVKYLLPLLGAILLFSQQGYSQVTPVRPGELHPILDSLFTSGRFDQVEMEALRILHSPDIFSEEVITTAYLYLGFVEILSANADAAEREFFHVLDRDPDLRLDPVYVPPLIYESFETARQRYFRMRQSDIDTSDVQFEELLAYRDAVDARCTLHRKATLLNLTFPGLGFFAEDQSIRGTAWFIAEAGCAAMFLISLDQAFEAHDHYLDARTEGEIQDTYDKYNSWYKKSWGWGIATVTVYLSSQVDLHLHWHNMQIEPALKLNSTPANPSESYPSYGLNIRW